jgi:lipopolysaccharide/colanic/teichoic acid biosynthesis glycosyltransferase
VALMRACRDTATARTVVPAYLLMKRLLDLVGATVALVLTAPIIAVSCAAVWMTSGSPVIHRRRVVGRFGRSFDAYKIRTMIRDADEVLARDEGLRRRLRTSGKVVDDPRVTRLGSLLRRTSADELPQLINVIRGEMSLVGPRMLTAEELPAWEPVRDAVLSVRPGMTGLWQVSGRQLLSREDRIRLDGDYVARMSLLLDVAILVRTVPTVLLGRGAM